MKGDQPELGLGTPPEGDDVEQVQRTVLGSSALPDAGGCEATTKRGSPCKRKPRPGRRLCAVHDEDDVEAVEVVVSPPPSPSTALAPPRRESAEYTDIMAMVAGREGPEALDMLERLVALKERAEDRDAERAMNHAVAGFKAECLPIPKDGRVEYPAKGRTVTFRHAKLSTVCKIVDPILTRHGLSYTWDSEPDDKGGLGRITTCFLRHIDGAVRTGKFHAPPSGVSTSADVQKVGAALLYGQRYSLIQVLGLTTTMDDVDGMGPDQPEDHGEPMTDEHLAELGEWIDSTGADKAKVLKNYGVTRMVDLPDVRFEEVREELQRVGRLRQGRPDAS